MLVSPVGVNIDIMCRKNTKMRDQISVSYAYLLMLEIALRGVIDEWDAVARETREEQWDPAPWLPDTFLLIHCLSSLLTVHSMLIQDSKIKRICI